MVGADRPIVLAFANEISAYPVIGILFLPCVMPELAENSGKGLGADRKWTSISTALLQRSHK